MLPPVLARSLTIPIVDGLRSRRQVLQRLKEAEELQWLSEREIVDRQWPRLKKLIHEAYTWVPFYRKRYDEFGISIEQIKAPEDMKLLPILTKEDINSHREEMVDPRYRTRVYTNFTGGSTGEPTRFYQVDEHWIMSTAATLKTLRWTGVNEGERTSLVWGHQLEAQRFLSKLEKIKFGMANRQFIPVLSLDESVLHDAARRMQDFKPCVIQGYNTYLFVLAKYILQNGIDGIRPKAIISSANTLLNSQRTIIEHAFEARVFNRYGSRELGCIASECSEHNGLHINLENVFVEFVPYNGHGGDDELFDLICTSMGNYGMPFIRYRIGDLGLPSSSICPCGRGLPLIERLKGRTHDILRTPSGRFITGDLFDIIFEEYSHLVKQFQVRQSHLECMEVTLVPQDTIEQKEADSLRSIIQGLVGKDVQVSVKVADSIPTSSSGKLHLTISEVGS